ncbi:hypothetical protein GF391_01235 [Candidatus Uhrbacteria bacterium]|nr:hypothetical protein [Candidatus Uhrbacteria bacterium]
MNEDKKRAIIKIVLFVVVMIAAGLFAYDYVSRKQSKVEFQTPAVNPEAGLGAEGALCGGDKRLPCMPGNKCEITNQETGEGVCVHVTDDPGPAVPPEN